MNALTATEPARPALRYHGGKWMLAPWIIGHFPPHRVYIEPYGGAASVLLRKDRAYAEVYGDLDDQVVTFFEVLRDRPEDLERALRLTPYARAEFDRAYEHTSDPLEQSRRLVIRSHMGFGSDGACGRLKTGFRADSNKSGSTPARDWARLPDSLPGMAARLQGVVLERRPALELMQKHDQSDALIYVDPPYILDTRKRKGRTKSTLGDGSEFSGAYRHEMTDNDHEEMLEALKSLKGGVVLSGYPHPLYDNRLEGWNRVQRRALADGAKERTEVLWISPRVEEMKRSSAPILNWIDEGRCA